MTSSPARLRLSRALKPWSRYIVEHGERDDQPARAFATFERAEAFAHRLVRDMDGSWVSITEAPDREALMLDLVVHMGVVAMDGLGRVSTRLTWDGADTLLRLANAEVGDG